MRRTTSGFTIVELTIVIGIIAILAAISMVSYQGAQTRAHDAVVKTDLTQIAKKLILYKADNRVYPFDPISDAVNASGTVIKPALETIDMKVSTTSYTTTTNNTNLLYIASNDGKQFAVLAYSKGSTSIYVTDKTNVAANYTGTGSAAYPTGSVGGIAAYLGIPSPAFYYVYTGSAGGWRIWT